MIPFRIRFSRHRSDDHEPRVRVSSLIAFLDLIDDFDPRSRIADRSETLRNFATIARTTFTD